MSKTCSKCDTKQSLDSFHKNKKNEDGHHYHCKSCRKAESLKLYGLTLQDYDDLLKGQNGCCKICKTTDPRGQSKAGRFYVDHNHTTGKVRGLLCNDCNTAIGLLKDNPLIVARAADYLVGEGYYG